MPQIGIEDDGPRGATGSGVLARAVAKVATVLSGREPGAQLALPQPGMDRDAKLHLAILAVILLGIMILGIAVARFGVLSLETIVVPTETPRPTVTPAAFTLAERLAG